MSVRMSVALIAAGAFFLTYLIGEGAGASISYVGGVGTYVVSSSVPSLLGALTILVAYSIGVGRTDPGSIGPLPGTGRRAVAWFIDFFFSLTPLTSVLALIP